MRKFIIANLFILLTTDLQASWQEDSAVLASEVYGNPQRGYIVPAHMRNRNMGPVPDIGGGSGWIDDVFSSVGSGLGNIFNLVFGPEDETFLTAWGRVPNHEGYTDVPLPVMATRPGFVPPKPQNKYHGKSVLEILTSIKQETDCQTAFEYLRDKDDFIGFNAASVQPFVLTKFVAYLQEHPEYFKRLGTLLCRGHDLDAHQIHTLLSCFKDRTAFLDLTPGTECQSELLTALAYRHCMANPNLAIHINGAWNGKDMTYLPLPEDGINLSRLPKGLTINNVRLVEDTEAKDLMIAIMDLETPVNITINKGTEHEKVIKL